MSDHIVTAGPLGTFRKGHVSNMLSSFTYSTKYILAIYGTFLSLQKPPERERERRKDVERVIISLCVNLRSEDRRIKPQPFPIHTIFHKIAE